MAGAEACQNLPKERYAMNDDTTISPLHQPGSILDPLTEIAREGARQMLAAALKAEAASFVARFADGSCSMAVSALFITGPGRSGRSRRGSGRSP